MEKPQFGASPSIVNLVTGHCPCWNPGDLVYGTYQLEDVVQIPTLAGLILCTWECHRVGGGQVNSSGHSMVTRIQVPNLQDLRPDDLK